jgi:hypothetical protein
VGLSLAEKKRVTKDERFCLMISVLDDEQRGSSATSEGERGKERSDQPFTFLNRNWLSDGYHHPFHHPESPAATPRQEHLYNDFLGMSWAG